VLCSGGFRSFCDHTWFLLVASTRWFEVAKSVMLTFLISTSLNDL